MPGMLLVNVKTIGGKDKFKHEFEVLFEKSEKLHVHHAKK